MKASWGQGNFFPEHCCNQVSQLDTLYQQKRLLTKEENIKLIEQLKHYLQGHKIPVRTNVTLSS